MTYKKKILRYLKGIIELNILKKKKGCIDFVAYVDNNFNSDLDDQRSVPGSVFLLDSEIVSWPSENRMQ